MSKFNFDSIDSKMAIQNRDGTLFTNYEGAAASPHSFSNSNRCLSLSVCMCVCARVSIVCQACQVQKRQVPKNEIEAHLMRNVLQKRLKM